MRPGARVTMGYAAATLAVLSFALLPGAAPAAAASIDSAPTSVAQATGDQCTAQTRLTDTPPAFAVLQVERAWTVTRGAGVTVAVVDSGVDVSSPRLSGAVLKGTSLVDGGDRYGRTDDFGHGTIIAGQIATQASGDSGLVGLAPGVKILPVRVYAGEDDEAVKAGNGPDIGRLATGIRYAADHGAQIINVSSSTPTDDERLRNAVAYATSKGSLVVASADNRSDGESDGDRFPAGDPAVLGVAALSADGVVTDASIHGPQVSLAAPGENVLSLSTLGGDCIFPQQGQPPATSYAAAYVSAAAALVAAAHPDETPAQWAYRLEVTARRADPDARDDVSGWGVVQPYSALTLVPGPGLRGPESPFVDAADEPATATPAAPVTVHDRAPVNAPAWAIVSVIGVLALAVLGTAGVLAVLRRNREGIDSPLSGAGLYGDETSSERL
ncbi:S8 family serine peptidase [Microbacterium horticulturae]|uniref:S8 family serine peptidase n=1 Tax=Microbacterium horticulturae TaxID=3028316 RepID=A0ABY8BZK5_9MICO|nr:S8 family serine peptidase [Microbacterium sp. KACC 23027]WEG08266.1 S8 family serine peptidase [Microbacterium sp. KACC 23027]